MHERDVDGNSKKSQARVGWYTRAIRLSLVLLFGLLRLPERASQTTSLQSYNRPFYLQIQ